MILLKENVEEDFENYYFNKFKVLWESPRDVRKNPKEYYDESLRELMVLLSKDEEIRSQLRLQWQIPITAEVWGDLDFSIRGELVLWVDFDDKCITLESSSVATSEDWRVITYPPGHIIKLLRSYIIKKN